MIEKEGAQLDKAVISGRVTLRRVRFEDIPDLMKIEAQAAPKTPLAPSLLLGYAIKCRDTFTVLEVDARIAGYIIFDRHGHVLSIAVEPTCRRKGFGTMLIHRASDSLHKKLWLEVRSKNTGALKFYEKLGFSLKGRHKNYYDRDDALVLSWERKTGE